MTEMTNEQTEVAEGSAPETTEVVQNSDSSPETQAEDKGSNVEWRINKLTAQRYAAEREAQDLKRQLEEANQSKPVAASTEEAPKLPDDMYDEAAMRQYHTDMLEYTQKAATSAAKSTFETHQQTAAEKAQSDKMSQTVQSYAEAGLRDGLTIEQMQMNEQVLGNAGINAELGGFIMADPNGAKIADYLAKNPDQMQSLNGMSPLQAAVVISNDIKVKAMGPSVASGAPDPVDQLEGGGARESDSFTEKCPGAVIK